MREEEPSTESLWDPSCFEVEPVDLRSRTLGEVASDNPALTQGRQDVADFVTRAVADAGIRTVHLGGELDLSSRAEAIEALCGGDEINVRADLAGLTFLDCTGYGGLMHARNALVARGGSLGIISAVGEPARLLGMLDVERAPCLGRTLNHAVRDGRLRPRSSGRADRLRLRQPACRGAA
jgi:anti-anti-sigma factor